jgi:hypothetical protein
VVVQARPAFHVDARIEVARSQASAAPPRAVVGFQTPFGESGQANAEVDPQTMRTFPTVMAGGQYIVRPWETGGWVVESVKMGDKDITDRVIELQADTSFVVTYTDRVTRVTGTVKDAAGAASEVAVVLAFPVDRRRWSGYGTTPRDIKSTLTSRAGVYTFAHLPAGEYYLIAIDPTDADGWQDPKRLEALAVRATRLTVAANDAVKTVNLTVESRR